MTIGQKVRVFTGYDAEGERVYRLGVLKVLPVPKWSIPGVVRFEDGREEKVHHTAIEAEK